MRRLPGGEIGAPASNGSPELCESRCRKWRRAARPARRGRRAPPPLRRASRAQTRAWSPTPTRSGGSRRRASPRPRPSRRRRRARTATRPPGAAPPRSARLDAWSGSTSRRAPHSRNASATRAPSASATGSGSPGRRRSCRATPTRRPARTSRRRCACRSSSARSPRRVRRWTTSCGRGSTSPTRRRSTRSAGRTARPSQPPVPRRPASSRSCSTHGGSLRSRPKR